ncbi:MAG: hypothetical protein MUE74_08800 [Bacteroidales bacterium]|jgi:hypothetical protein|nr:hypothetical protein [Bacteroidales bacterium]
MKRIILLSVIAWLTLSFVSAQKLLDIYKSGPVRLVADKTYGAKNDWGSLFNLYYDTLRRDVGRETEKKIILAPDGSLFMSHRNRHEIWKFGPDGNFIKAIGSKGGKQTQFPMMPNVNGIVDGKYFFTNDVNGRMRFFDLNGNFFKAITLDYMTQGFQPLDNGMILIEGNVMWKNEEPGTRNTVYRWRHIIVRLNIYSGEEKIIYEVFEQGDMRVINAASKDSMRMEVIPPPDGKIYLPNYMIFRRPVFVLLKSGQFFQFDRRYGEVKYMNSAGKEISRFKLDITPVEVTEKDALEHYESVKVSVSKSIAIARSRRDSTIISRGERGTTPGTVIMAFPNSDNSIKSGEKILSNIERLKDINSYFPHLPYFSNIIVDDEGNLLVFEFTSAEEKQSNIFKVIAYDENGRQLARTSFICDDYDLSFSESRFVISKGYVYAIAKLKNSSGMPLRLVRFRMTN